MKWQCRRGQLELDILLLAFLESEYASLSVEEKTVFQTLLTHSDPELYRWLIEGACPQDHTLFRMVERIKRHAQSTL